MQILPLHVLVSKSIAKGIIDGTLHPTRFPFNPNCHVLTELNRLTLPTYEPEIYTKLLHTFNFSTANHQGFWICRNMIQLFQNQNLTSLALGRFSWCQAYMRKRSRSNCAAVFEDLEHKAMDLSNPINIVAIVGDCLNNDSQKDLLSLSIDTEVHETTKMFLPNWIAPLAEMLPKLQSLSISGRVLEQNDFQALCSGFPHLQKLNISGTRIKNLSGISHLRNLEVLSIGNLKLGSAHDLVNIFNLPNLKVLSLSCEGSCREPCCPRDLLFQFLECDRVMPELVYLDVSFNGLPTHWMGKVMNRCPKLEVLSVIGPITETDLTSAIEIISSHNLPSITKALRHYMLLHNRPMLMELFKILMEVLDNVMDLTAKRELQDCSEVLCEIHQKYQGDYTILDESAPILVMLMIHHQLLEPPHKIDILNCLFYTCNFFLDNSYFNAFYPKFESIFQVVDNPSITKNLDFNIQKFYLVAFRVIGLSIEEESWKVPCIGFLHNILNAVETTEAERQDQISTYSPPSQPAEMEVPTLQVIAAASVANGLAEGSIHPTNFPLSESSSSKILKDLFRLTFTNYSPELYTRLCAMIKVSKVDHKGFWLCDNSIRLFRAQNLRSLTLGRFDWLESHMGRNTYGETKFEDLYHKEMIMQRPTNIVKVLEHVLNDDSQKELMLLNIDTEVYETRRMFCRKWVTPIINMLPQLQSLSIYNRILTAEDFQSICTGFPNLRSLNISGTRLNNLSGISQLQDLEVLSIGNLKFQSSMDLIDIFNLPKLKVLNMSCETSCRRENCCNRVQLLQFLECNRLMPELLSLDVSFNILPNHWFSKVMERCPKIKQVAIIGGIPVWIQGIEVISAHNLKAVNQALKHYMATDNRPMILELLDMATEILEDAFEDEIPLTIEDLQSCSEIVCRINDIYQSDYPIHHKSAPTLSFLLKNRCSNKTKILNCLHYICNFFLDNNYFDKFFPKFEYIFEAIGDQQLLMDATLPTSFKQFYPIALRVLELTTGDEDWKMPCIAFIDRIRLHL
ncbi:hypothetical protein GCK72_004154 [Caenorhabditis remanei]|uniref:Uncharacterized protein n=1 Tax=Caenorhabditis remanei TaxID=31234 RepID=A0A6A5HAN9_CAERE|nr:hypothetical protein GCK72_004154 [Caenorhabditis remanei]KAF1764207.1 hypothetical protein GCK72_004154 [Caenorhabditis remanei]